MKRTAALLFTLPISMILNSAAQCQSISELTSARGVNAPTVVASLSPAVNPLLPLSMPSNSVQPGTQSSAGMGAGVLPRTGAIPSLKPAVHSSVKPAVHSYSNLTVHSSVNPAKHSSVKPAVQSSVKPAHSAVDVSKKNVQSSHSSTQAADKNSSADEVKTPVSKDSKDAKVTKISTRIICSSSLNCKKDSEEKWLALTFDDGPSPDYTLQILALLKQYNIHATFCLIGRQVKKYPEIVEQIVADGHKIALHSMNHDENLSRRSDKKIKSEILGEKELLDTIVPDAQVDYYRAPGGNWNLHVRKMITSWGLKPLGWSVDTKDWERPGVDSIIENVNNELHPGGVVLMHDAGGNRNQTVAALKQLLPTLKAEGYQFGFPN